MFTSKTNQRRIPTTLLYVLAIMSIVLASCGQAATVSPTATTAPSTTVPPTATTGPTSTVPPTATTAPSPTPKPVKLVYGNLPRNDTLIIAGTASNDVWDTFTMMSGPLTNAYSGYQQVGIEQAFLFAGGKYYPYLAQKWEYNADGTQMTLYLTTTATWNDGKPVTIDDWTFTLDYLHANKDKGVPFGTLLDSASYKTDGTDKIIFSFFDQKDPTKPVANWRFNQTIAGFVPLAKHIWEGQDPMTFKNNPPVEAGPYTLVNCNADTKTCIWQRRDDYWKKDENLAFKYIVFTRQPEADLLTQDMIAGNFDLSQLTPKLATTVVMPQNKNISMVEWPDPCPRQLMFNMQNAPLNDPAFRHAMSLLIDRQKAGQLDNPASKPIVLPWPYQGDPTSPFVNPADLTNNDVGVYDPVKAAKVLDDAGYKLVNGKRVGKDGKPISLSIMTFDPSIHGAAVNGFPQMMAAEAAKIGVELLPKVVEVGVYFDNGQKGNFDMMYQWVCGVPTDPIAAYQFLHSRYYQPIGTATTSFGQHLGYKDPATDALIEKVEQGNPADPALADVYKQLFHTVTSQWLYVPLFALYQGFPWNNEYFTGPKSQVEPWFWMYQFRGMMMFMKKVQ